MSLANLSKKGSLRSLATATPATPATVSPNIPPSVATVATVAVAEATDKAANDPAPDTDRWYWPHSSAMNTVEIDIFMVRLRNFTDKGLPTNDAETLADKLVLRDRDQDGRRVCLECRHLGGRVAGSWRCGNWQAAGIAILPRDTQLPADLVLQFQRCDGFRTATPNSTTKTPF
jgi:hypothetical protein